MIDAEAAARDFVQQRYPDALAAYLGGSAATGQATPTSGLDIFVLLDERSEEISFVEATPHQGWLVEAFVYTPSSAGRWIKKGRAERRPVLDSLIGTGLPLTQTDVTPQWADRSRAALAAGPPGADPTDVDARRYALSALVDDLEDTTDSAETFAIQSSAFREAAELALLVDRRWLGTGKWLVRNLREGNDHGLLAWVDGPRDSDDLRGICRQVLEMAGGFLQEGFVRGHRTALGSAQQDPGRSEGVAVLPRRLPLKED